MELTGLLVGVCSSGAAPKGDYKPTVIRGQPLPADLPEPDDPDDDEDDDDFDQAFDDDPVDDPDDDLDDLDR